MGSSIPSKDQGGREGHSVEGPPPVPLATRPPVSSACCLVCAGWWSTTPHSAQVAFNCMDYGEYVLRGAYRAVPLQDWRGGHHVQPGVVGGGTLGGVPS